MGKLRKLVQKMKFKFVLEQLNPLLIRLSSRSISFSLSERFLLFQFLNQASRKIEDNPYLNFLSIIKNYKIFGRILGGTIHDFYRDRNKSYFVNFFVSKELYAIVKSDIERVHSINNDLKVTIFKEGFIIYDNYKTNQFNLFLLTCHSGTYITPSIEKKMLLTKEQRYREEDIASDELYSKLVLKQGGIWIDNKLSRYYCDLNRNSSNCIYGSKPFADKKALWKTALTKAEEEKIHEVYRKFYFLLTNLLDTYKFNVILDGHTMKDMEGRTNISLGTHFIPKFYLPIVGSIKRKIKQMDYGSVGINKPFRGGFILEWMSLKFPCVFILSMEFNKKLYMTKNRVKVIPKKVEKLSEDIVNIFDIIEDEGYRAPLRKP